MKIKKHCNNCYIIYTGNKDIHIRKENIDDDQNIFIVDVFDSIIEDAIKAHIEDLSELFDDYRSAIEYLNEDLNIPKKITNQIIINN